jgi:hypothetical protein
VLAGLALVVCTPATYAQVPTTDAMRPPIPISWDANPTAERVVVSSCQTDFRKTPCRMEPELAGALPGTATGYLATLPTNPRWTKCYTVETHQGTQVAPARYWLCFPPAEEEP